MESLKKITEVEINKKFSELKIKELGRRPTTRQDIQGLLTLIDKIDGNVMEIGTWDGKTTYELATAFPDKKIYTIDFLENTLSPIEENARTNKENLCVHAKHLNNVFFSYQKSEEIDYNVYENIKIVFIDGNHSFEGCKCDSEKALKFLKDSPGSIICWHDYGVPIFGVTKYIDTEISSKYLVKKFTNSSLVFIEI